MEYNELQCTQYIILMLNQLHLFISHAPTCSIIVNTYELNKISNDSL
jgi:hypothetical protein